MMPTYYEELPICKAAADVAVRVDPAAYLFARPLARESELEKPK